MRFRSTEMNDDYAALDRLNSWLRAPQPLFCVMRSRLKPVVYWVKNAAILGASKVQPIGLRRVKFVARCRVCGGSGIFERWHWSEDHEDEGEFCRTCNATGNVTLKFIESTIGPFRWHTPEMHWRGASLDVYVPFSADGDYEDAADWKPNTPGKPLTPAEVERDALTVLHAWPKDFGFIVEFHNREACVQKQYGVTDMAKAETWIHTMRSEAELREHICAG